MAALTDGEIREMAEKRVSFRFHLLSYVLVNVFLVGVWWFTARDAPYWPLWAHLGWGIGIAFHAWSAYGPQTQDAVKREEEKLRKKYGRG